MREAFSEIDDSVGIVMPILMECDKDEDFSEGIDKVGESLPILSLRNMVLFPGVAMPVIVGRAKSMRLIREASHKKMMIGGLCQKETCIRSVSWLKYCGYWKCRTVRQRLFCKAANVFSCMN